MCVHIYLDTYAKNLFHKLCTLYPLFIFRENRYSLKISEDTFSSLETFFTQEINFPFLEVSIYVYSYKYNKFSSDKLIEGLKNQCLSK